jgi:hypothetical protein
MSQVCGSLSGMPTRPLLPTRVVAPSGGTSVGTRLRLTSSDRQLLRAVVGERLGAVRGHDLPAALRGESQNARAKHLSVAYGVHSRYAGSIVRPNDAQVRLAREGL